MKMTPFFLMASLLFVSCGNTPGGRSYQLTNGQADLSPQCQTIIIDSPNGSYTLNAIKTQTLDVETAYPLTITANCLDGNGTTTGRTIVKVTKTKVELRSSENSPLSSSYAKNHDTQGIFPIVLE